MDIVFLTDHLVRGGAETQLTRIAATLKRRGWTVGIITLLPSEEFLEDVHSADIPLFECSRKVPKRYYLPLSMAFRLVRQLRHWRPSVLISFNYHSDIMGRVCGRLAGVPAIVASQRTAHVKTPLRMKTYRVTEGLIRLTVSNSHAAITYMLKRGILTPRKTMVIPNGILASSFPAPITREEARKEFPFSKDAFIWLAVGNLRPAKDYPTLLVAAERCAAATPRFHLLIAGSGEEEASLLAEANRRNLSGRVHFLGSRKDVSRLLRACDAFVLSSAWEGLPNSVMEAMASGVPVVSTDAGGARELVLQGICGYIVPTRDPDALSDGMLHVMAMSQDERIRMGDAGRERILRYFDNERVVDRWEVMIQQVIRAEGRPLPTLGKPDPSEPIVMAEQDGHRKAPPPGFIVSLDFELMWGNRDKRTLQDYGANILGEREAIPAMLRMFKRYGIRATWAAVGMTLFERRSDLLAHLPDTRPTYEESRLNPYLHLDAVGIDEKHDPYHFGLSLVKQILDYDGMELGSHTFSHYYCLEKGQDASQFKADLEAFFEASNRLCVRPTSFVFPRNQYNFKYLSVCSELGFDVFRGNESSWMYQESTEQDQSSVRRAARLADNYIDITGHHGFIPRQFLDCNMINCPSSRFLRPFYPKLAWIEEVRVHRLQEAMEAAARRGESFHLWWHPHNFGTNLKENLSILEKLLRFHLVLRDRYGVVPMNMGEAGRHALEAEGLIQ
jgi:glycosyltransferase involved in cell wall biosynthesis/peptidoglycan/xylan/chitin deacetylase (PgdA/CDA1 family)